MSVFEIRKRALIFPYLIIPRKGGFASIALSLTRKQAASYGNKTLSLSRLLSDLNQAINSRERMDFLGADFSGQELNEVNLERADLSFSDFTGANLSGADLGLADLRHAKFSRAKIVGVKIDNAVEPSSFVPEVPGGMLLRYITAVKGLTPEALERGAGEEDQYPVTRTLLNAIVTDEDQRERLLRGAGNSATALALLCMKSQMHEVPDLAYLNLAYLNGMLRSRVNDIQENALEKDPAIAPYVPTILAMTAEIVALKEQNASLQRTFQAVNGGPSAPQGAEPPKPLPPGKPPRALRK